MCVCVCVCAGAEPRVVSVWVGVVWAGGVRGAGGGRADAHAPTAKVASLPAPQATHRKHRANPAMGGGGVNGDCVAGFPNGMDRNSRVPSVVTAKVP